MILLVSFGLVQVQSTSVSDQIVDPVKKMEKKSEILGNNTIDKGHDNIEKGSSRLSRKDKQKKSEKQSVKLENKPLVGNLKDEKQLSVGQQSGDSLNWAKFDFVPGDKVIFEDNIQNEENGEFPTRWDLQKGNIEIAEFGGEKVIMFMSGSSCIVPFLKNPEKDYLPEIFTIEFDAYYDIEPHSAKYFVALYDKKNQRGIGPSLQRIQLYPGGIQFEGTKNLISGGDGLWYNKKNPFWRHISIGFNIRSLKVYYDDVRMLNIPNLGFNPSGLSIEIINTKPLNFYIKNIRIAEGGQKLYDKFLQDGKIVTNAIRFDVNKATLRPESMGIINKIAEFMNDNPEISFSVEGHTDSDGDNAFNQQLSEVRAAKVVGALTQLGIASTRLTSKGWGESKPLDSNSTPEGKANNRRVEFLKM